MAEEKRFLKGLFKDSGHIDQMKGSWRHALNMFMNEKEGSLSNEGGTSPKGHLGKNVGAAGILGQNSKVIGAIEVTGDNVVLFLADSTGSGKDHIALWDGITGAFQDIYIPNIIFTNSLLNFSITHPIEGTFKVDSKGDLVVYWTDDLNPPRALNITRQQREVPLQVNRWKLYNINPGTTHRDHIGLLNLFPSAGPVPHIELDDIISVSPRYQRSIVEGGGLRTAVYYLALAYVDVDLVSTNYLSVSNPVSIVDEYDHTKPTVKKDGAKDGSQTSKSIKWVVSNLNTDYTRLRPTIIRKMGDEIKAIKLNDVEITGTSGLGVVYSGVEGAAAGDLEKVIIDTVGYDTAKTINQLDGVLYVGNVTGTKDVGFQKYANNIKLKSVTHDITDFDEYYATVDHLATGYAGKTVDKFNGTVQTVDESKSYRYVPNIYKYKGYMRSEVYAFYIAFIMNDGSMSYAYHIPGRAICDDGTALGQPELAQPSGFATSADFIALSKGYAKNFHFFEYSFTGGAYAGLPTREMNYWQNATEFYPNTDDFKIWDQTGLVGSLQGANVRHHHFPSNENNAKKSVLQDHGCLTAASEGVAANSITPWNAKMVMIDGREHQNTWYNCCSSWTTNTFNMGQVSSSQAGTVNIQAMEDALWNFSSNRFTADQCMNVTIKYLMAHRQDGSNDPSDDVRTKIKIVKNGVASYHCQDTDGHPIQWGGCGGNCGTTGQNWVGYNSSQAPCSSGYSVALQPGDTIELISQKETSPGTSMYQAGWSQHCGSCINGIGAGQYNYSFISFDVTSCAALVPLDIYQDALISHDVRRLGFTLDDIKIPDTIADKVQGFRIYYAKRKHSDRTILGQAPLIPMVPQMTSIGLCKEAAGDADAMQVLATTQTEPEQVYSAYPWAGSSWWYGTPDWQINDADGTLMDSVVTDTNGVEWNYSYEAFTFHDFYLLRTKNSLAGATHITPIYHVKNLVWNGPSLDQDKRMQTKLVKDKNTDPEILMPREEWGWDANTNCYSQRINSSIHVGMYYRTGYRSMGSGSVNLTYRFPRVLGQKAKTYLKGDSIFNGKSLGFGGKVINLFGESSIIFKVKDNHGMNPYGNINAPGWGNCLNSNMYTMGNLTPFCTAANSGCGGYDPVTSCGGYPSGGNNNWGDWGHNHYVGPPLLVNSSDNAGGPPVGNRSTYFISNLDAFKTDVYKSIDSQELIWTGFEILGNDIDNFVFTSATSTALTNTHNGETADYSIDTVQGANWQNVDPIDTGIYGGDTYLCRYGISATLTPSDIDTPSNPKKAIHYHIVESTDNINFRHIESDKTLYFPGTPAKDILRLAGSNDDFTDQENIKYNKNYSELNDLRVAFPLPLSETKQLDFPTRVHRSAKNDSTSLIDNYRVWLSNQFKDLPKNRGELWKLASFNNLLYFHMQESLLKSQGKQSMQMNDGSDAYVGSGDIFKQEPAEIVLTDDGYGGTQSQWAVLTTRFGHFFVDVSTKKVFLMKDKLQELSDLGMKKWFRKNLHFTATDFGFPLADYDNPIIGMGLHSIWDPKHRRIILTKKEFIPTALFQALYVPWVGSGGAGFLSIRFNPNTGMYQMRGLMSWVDMTGGDLLGQLQDPVYWKTAGWTVSYYPELNVWVSLHSYAPYIYFNTSTNFYSLCDHHPILDQGLTAGSTSGIAGSYLGNATIWEHNSNRRGLIYQDDPTTLTPNDYSDYADAIIYRQFEIEYIHNELRNVTSLHSSFAYTADVYNEAGIRVLEHGFTSYFLYNTLQLSGLVDTPLEYLINTRRIGNNWKINRFRDMAAIAVDTTAYYTSPNINVIGGLNTGTITTSSINPMFIYTGIIKYPNPAYLNLAKNWTDQKKFIDKWIGIRLIYDNISNNLLNLYSTTVESRIMTR